MTSEPIKSFLLKPKNGVGKASLNFGLEKILGRSHFHLLDGKEKEKHLVVNGLALVITSFFLKTGPADKVVLYKPGKYILEEGDIALVVSNPSYSKLINEKGKPCLPSSLREYIHSIQTYEIPFESPTAQG